MDRKDKLEGEEIQEGLEKFLERELDLSLAQTPTQASVQTSVPKQDDIALWDMGQAQDARQTRSVGQPQGARQPQSVRQPQGARQTQSMGQSQGTRNSQSSRSPRNDRTQQEERVQREMPKRKTASKNSSAKRDASKKKADTKKKNRAKKALILIAVLILIGFIGLYLIVSSMYGKMNYAEVGNYAAESMKEDGVVNVLLIGNDSRLAGDDGRSDAMILVSISDKTKTITMTSFLRDMYVEIPGHGGNRLNAAYSYGGPELLMQTIEENFDIPVHRYALVNFQAFANLVDAVGGVDLELTNDEVQYVNGYLMEYNQLEGRDLATDFLDPSLSGMIHLNGPQALAYSRNRYIGTDFGRTERQRKVLSAVFQKLPGTVLTNSGELTDGLFPNLTTNLRQGECYQLSLNAWKILGYDMVQQYVPIDGSYSNATIRGMAVLEVDMDANIRFLKSTIYGE
ncbi:MAG: LCP family protein [Lachnospiraceae bacterium]|nr:LCP family protein [Lachnospiraceae bacterium]